MVEGDDELAEKILGRGFLAPQDLEREPVSPSIPEQDDRYDLLELLGKGSSGEVWKARDRELERFVAVKLLKLDPRRESADELERFRREALAMAALRHEGIPAVFDARTSGTGARVVMELVQGRSFHLILDEGLHSLAERVAIVEHVARIVHFAHERGFIHRDLKPSNVMIGGDGRPRVLDFGIARHVASDSHLTRVGDVLGTPGFMSPEQALGHSRAVTARSDVFSLGAMLFFAVSKRLPFERVPELVEPRSAAPPIEPPELDAVARRALAKDPARRHETALAFAEELAAWRRAKERRWGLLTALACGLIALTLGAWLGFRSPGAVPPEKPSPVAPSPGPPSRPSLEPKLESLGARLAERAERDPAGAEAALDDAIRELEAARSR